MEFWIVYDRATGAQLWRGSGSTGVAAAQELGDSQGIIIVPQAVVQTPEINLDVLRAYPFEAGAMIAAIFGCGAARYWIGAAQALRKEHKWSLDIPVTAMALATSAAVIISQRPEPLGALFYGAGLGVLGEGIFKLAEAYLHKATTAFGLDGDTEK